MIKNMGLGRQTAWIQILFAAFTHWMTEQVNFFVLQFSHQIKILVMPI